MSEKYIKFIVTWFYSGLLPHFPGTWGSLFTLPFVILWYMVFGTYGIKLFFIFSTIFGTYCTYKYLKFHDIKFDDPSYIVIDEVAGQALVFLMCPPSSLKNIILGFILFRIFDIWKPWPICWIDQNVKGTYILNAIGIMGDDILAGFFAGISLYLLTIIF